MKVAIIGSRELYLKDLGKYLPPDTTEIVSGGAKGVDTCAAEYAKQNGIPLKVFPPEYKKYGRGAPLKRNLQIIDYADLILAFWDGKSKGTRYVVDQCQKRRKNITVIHDRQ